MIDVGDMFDIETEYDHVYDCTLGLKYRGTKTIDGATLRMIGKNTFEVVFANEIVAKLEIGI